MTVAVELRATSPDTWLKAVCDDFDAFLLDHASAERKASAMAVSFVVQYPDRFVLHLPMIRIAREELLHYQQVMELIHARELVWQRDERDPYIQQLHARMSTDRDGRLLDRLLMGAVVEARGVERFARIGRALSGDLASFYRRLAASEARHSETFLSLASNIFDTPIIESRFCQWLDWEAEAMRLIPPRPALH